MLYDMYGMEGVRSGLELGPRLKTPEEMRKQYEKMKATQEERRLEAKVRRGGVGSFIYTVYIRTHELCLVLTSTPCL